jgi:hypothetical protein
VLQLLLTHMLRTHIYSSIAVCSSSRTTSSTSQSRLLLQLGTPQQEPIRMLTHPLQDITTTASRSSCKHLAVLQALLQLHRPWQQCAPSALGMLQNATM